MQKKNKIVLVLNSLFWLIFLLVFQNKEYSFDSLEYSMNVRSGENLFHPHHLLYNAFGYFVYNLFKGSIDPLVLLAGINAILVSAVFILIYLTLKNNGISFSRALAYSNLFAVSSGALYIGVSVEVYAFALFFQTLALYILTRNSNGEPNIRDISLIAIISSLGALFHQTAIFSIPIIAIYLAYKNKSYKSAAIYLGLSIFLISAAYLYCASYYGYSGIGKTVNWALYYMNLPEYGGGALGKIQIDSFWRSLGGIAQTIFAFSIDLSYYEKFPYLFDIGILFAIAFVVAFIKAMIARLKLIKINEIKFRFNINFLFLSLALINSIFAFWWEPNNFEFWLLSSPYWIMFFALTNANKESAPTRINLRFMEVNINNIWLSGACLSLLFANFCLKIYPASKLENNRLYTISKKLAGYLPDDKRLVISNIIELNHYLKYFHNKSIEQKSLTRVNYIFESEKDKAKNEFKNFIDTYLENGDVYLLENELYPSFDKLSYYKNWKEEDYKSFYIDFIKNAVALDFYDYGGKKFRIFILLRKNYA